MRALSPPHEHQGAHPSAAVTGALRPFLPEINMVSAPLVAARTRHHGRGIECVTTSKSDYDSFIRITHRCEGHPTACRRHGLP